MIKLLPIVTLLILPAACAEPIVPVTPGPDYEYVRVADVPPVFVEQLDVLFVVDNTRDMQSKQQEMTYAFERLLTHLQFAEGGMPDLHVGVVSTDMGVLSYSRTPTDQLPEAKTHPDIENCSVNGGDDGALLNAPRIDGCAPPFDRYLENLGVGEQFRQVNYPGNIVDAFECISQLGSSGCIVEQPLEAMRRALDGTQGLNDGFYRPDAVLAVVILTTEDDCSAFNREFYNPMLDGTGEFSKFRCFKYGVRCDGDDVFQFGLQSGCRPYPESEHLYEVGAYSDFLIGLKTDPRKVVATSISGNAVAVEVAQDIEGKPLLVPACIAADGGTEVYPSVRLEGFVDGLPNSGELSSLCAEDQTMGALGSTARQIRKSLGTSCLEGYLLDVEPDEAGLQFACRVNMVPPDASLTEAMQPCDDQIDHLGSGPAPCYAIKAGGVEGCGDFETQLSVFVNWGGPDATAPHGMRTHVECLIDPAGGAQLDSNEP